MAAAADVRDRLRRATAALCAHVIPHAVVGECAVAEWVEWVDPTAVRNTQTVQVLLDRTDLPAAKVAMESAGLIVSFDGVDAKNRGAVHVLFAGEKVRPEHLLPAPGLNESQAGLLSIDPLVRMKLTSFLRGDRVDVRDLIDAGLIDATWPAKFPPELAARLQELLDTPDG
ncbi:hypothetical protein [Limnoglobus roseus]|uniref:Uncharacterized protein n=1 Tax=Limnoglobus roseus TaxID=2598579 RepID=A0A5C1A6F9_9BACT|nr:hypothetical protein [Limnoglobus roseus]QEL13965.1 hypothetical protein PX52LOC_00825 [Limnoglobus roseus]